MMSSFMPIVVTHFTRNTGYEKEVQNLIRSLHRWDLEYDVEAIDSLGSWRANSNYCTTHIHKMLLKYPDRDVLRVDADAVFQQFPGLFLEDTFTADVAAHIHDFRWHKQELLGGTIFFRNTPDVRRLVERWQQLSRSERPKDRNPDLLKELIDSKQYNVKFGCLPPEYCRIFDLMIDTPNPVIEHFQASRRFRRQVNAQGAK